MEVVILDLVLSGALEDKHILPWLKEKQHSIKVSEAVATRLRHQHTSLDAPSRLQPSLLREAVLNAVRYS